MRKLLSLLLAIFLTAVPRAYTALAANLDHQPAAKTTTFTLKGAQFAGYLAVDAQGDVYIDGGTASLLKLSPAGRVLARWEGLRFDADQPDSAAGVALDPQGDVYVVDTNANRVIKLSPNLQLLAQWGGFGAAPGQFIEPEGIALDTQGNIYVADTGNSRVQKLSPTGSVLAVWDDGSILRNPIALTVDPHGTVYVVDAGYNTLVKLSPSGQHLATWDLSILANGAHGYGVDLAVDQMGQVFVADQGSQAIVILSPAGNEQTYWTLDKLNFYTVVGLTRSPQGTIYASECPAAGSYANICRVVKLSPQGKPLTVWISHANPVTPGTTVKISGYGLHLRCLGQGSPTVILESGYGTSSGQWWFIQPEVATFTRVCSYDRAGVGLSGAPPDTVNLSGLRTARELHALLHRANIPAPYVLAGYDFGGILVRLFAATYPSEVAGLVLIDAIQENYCARFKLSVCGPQGGELPDWTLTFQQMHQATGGVIKGSLGDIPLIVLSQNTSLAGCLDCVSAPQLKDPARVWNQMQATLASASSNAVHVIAQRSGHAIPFEQPGLVVDAIHQVVGAARASSHTLAACATVSPPWGGQCVS